MFDLCMTDDFDAWDRKIRNNTNPILLTFLEQCNCLDAFVFQTRLERQCYTVFNYLDGNIRISKEHYGYAGAVFESPRGRWIRPLVHVSLFPLTRLGLEYDFVEWYTTVWGSL